MSRRRDNEHVIKVAARLAPGVGDELKAAAAPKGPAFSFLNYLVADAASSRKVSYQMDDIGGYSFKPPDGLKHLDIEMLPLGGGAVGPLGLWSSLVGLSSSHMSLMLYVYTSSKTTCRTALFPCWRRE